MTLASKGRIGVAGLGTVGASLVNFLSDRSGRASRASGQTVRITGVSAHTRSRARTCDVSTLHLQFGDDPVALAGVARTTISSSRLIGGTERVGAGGRRDGAAERQAGCYGQQGFDRHPRRANSRSLAEANNAPLLFEAAVMGGAPALKMLREAMVGDQVEVVAGILNGTCNYILTEMEAWRPSSCPLDVLAEAQRPGLRRG